MEHLVDAKCSCEYCQMVDCLYGDPLLSKWEASFVENIAEWGWRADYTDKQKKTIKRIFEKMKLARLGSRRKIFEDF